jgi:hypothetical protein
MAEQKVRLNSRVGTMIEVPRGALTAGHAGDTCESGPSGPPWSEKPGQKVTARPESAAAFSLTA